LEEDDEEDIKAVTERGAAPDSEPFAEAAEADADADADADWESRRLRAGARE
jgi:hypothetical protein